MMSTRADTDDNREQALALIVDFIENDPHHDREVFSDPPSCWTDDQLRIIKSRFCAAREALSREDPRKVPMPPAKNRKAWENRVESWLGAYGCLIIAEQGLLEMVTLAESGKAAEAAYKGFLCGMWLSNVHQELSLPYMGAEWARHRHRRKPHKLSPEECAKLGKVGHDSLEKHQQESSRNGIAYNEMRKAYEGDKTLRDRTLGQCLEKKILRIRKKTLLLLVAPRFSTFLHVSPRCCWLLCCVNISSLL